MTIEGTVNRSKIYSKRLVIYKFILDNNTPIEI